MHFEAMCANCTCKHARFGKSQFNLLTPTSASQVLLLMWTQNVDLRMQLQALELFSGQGKVSQVLREEGVNCASYDFLYDPTRKSMNFLSPGGFAFQAQSYLHDWQSLKPVLAS